MSDILSKIYDYSLEEIMGERFGRYSKYIIQERAIPDIRDGLKPVQRRIIYSMYKVKNTYEKGYRKSAKTVGDVIGNYHPHGDTSIYEAMVRMSQPWKVKNLLIDMHGNNGSVDGDSPAHYRYTEARLSKISNELVKDIDKNTVIFTPNFDDTDLEPTVLPAKFPNLLINGSSGISAGYATNIPPHNLGEIIDATIKRLDDSSCSLDSIMEIVKGPDFPTGGIIEGFNGIKEAYETGKGRIIVKSVIDIKKQKGKEQIIISNIPYEVNKAELVRKIDFIRIEKKIEGLADARDESDRKGLRIAIDLKKDADSEAIANYLLKNTSLQISYNFNMIAIVNKRPKLLGLLDILDAYIKHQKEVITKRTEFDLEHAKRRLHIVEGLIKALGILDEVISTIRSSKNKIDAQDNLVNKFDFTNYQAEAIVMLQLYRLTNTDVALLKEELNKLNIIIKGLKTILNSPEKLKEVIKDELNKIKKEYDCNRLTVIKEEITEIKVDTSLTIPKEDVIVVVTKDGYVKRVSIRSYKSYQEEPTLLKDLDYIIGIYKMSTLDTLLIFTDLGNYLYIPVYDIPDTKWRELGKHISNIITIKSDENIIGCMSVTNFNDNKIITTFTKNGMIKRTKLAEYEVQRYSKPIKGINLKKDDRVTKISNSDLEEVLVVTNKGYGLWYDVNEISITGIKTSGVKAINLKNDYVVSGVIFDQEMDYITIITDKGTGKRIKLNNLTKTSRAKRGVLLIKEVKANPYKIIDVMVTSIKNMIGIRTEKEIKILKVIDFPIMDRYSTGSSLVKGNIKDGFIIQELMESPEEELDDIQKKEINLKEIDEQILTIDDFLDDVDLE